MNDHKRLENWIRYTEQFPKDTRVRIEFLATSGPVFNLTGGELKDILMTVWFDVPALRKALDDASRENETLKEQIVDETLSFETSPKWEYEFFIFNPGMNIIAKSNQMGAVGWEMIYIDFVESRIIFKRPTST